MHEDPIMDLIDAEIRMYTILFFATPIVGMLVLAGIQYAADHFG